MALPIMFSNVTTPLLGLVDTGVVGQLEDPVHIGGVALGALVFTSLYFGFGFLRMATTGLTAQAVGAGDREEVITALGRPVLVALAMGFTLVALSWPIREVAFAIVEGSVGAERLARDYFDIRVWSAPAALVNYALLGWFIGLGRTRIALGLQVVSNLTNMVLDAVLVLELGWGVAGVAAGSVAAEMLSAALGLFIASRRLAGCRPEDLWRRLRSSTELRRTFAVSGDIFIRSLALVSVIAFFMAKSAEQGDVRLAANSVLMQFVSTSAYFLDGIAFTAEAFVGYAVGARNVVRLRAAAFRTSTWAVAVAGMISLAFVVVGPSFIDVLTVDPTTRETARVYLPWAVGAPLAGVLAFQLDGIFVGATQSADMRNAMLASLAIFAVGWWLLRSLENHGLWASLYVHYVARFFTLACYWPRLVRSVAARV